MPRLSPPIRRALGLSALVLTLLAFLHLGLTLTLESTTRRVTHSASYVLPPASTIAVASLNHRAAAADLIWVNAIQYGASRYLSRRSASEATDFAHTIIDLDPRFQPVYTWHNAARTLSTPSVTPDDIAQANVILQRGLKTFPDEWEFARAIAANHIGHTYERPPEEHLADMEEAYTYAKMASEIPEAPPEMLLLATSFQRRVVRARARVEGRDLEEHELQASPEEIAFLMKAYFAAGDPDQQNFLLRRLYELGAGRELVARIEAYQQAFERDHRRRDYLPPDVFALSDPGLYRPDDIGLTPDTSL
ncbi:hypothetical protein [Lujinxingia litoralis]|nr:hypothetical protein [Lujinxingia litoralis]